MILNLSLYPLFCYLVSSIFYVLFTIFYSQFSLCLLYSGSVSSIFWFSIFSVSKICVFLVLNLSLYPQFTYLLSSIFCVLFTIFYSCIYLSSIQSSISSHFYMFLSSVSGLFCPHFQVFYSLCSSILFQIH